jgi:hypothetical protein
VEAIINYCAALPDELCDHFAHLVVCALRGHDSSGARSLLGAEAKDLGCDDLARRIEQLAQSMACAYECVR